MKNFWGSSLVSAALGALLIVLPTLAHADKVSDLSAQLRGSSDVKVRLAATLALIKLGDGKAVPALVAALSDSDRNVRSAAAAGLGKLVTGKTPAATRTQALAALDKATKDANDLVRKQATKAAEALRALAGGTAGGGGTGGGGSAAIPTGGFYIDVGVMGTKATDADAGALKDLMRKTTVKMVGKTASEMVSEWPGGKAPKAADLTAKKLTAYHVDGTLTELTTKDKGSMTIVSCKVSMLIATYPDKSMFAFLNGGASVQAGTTAADIRSAKDDCVGAVVEDLVVKKIVPTIRTRGGT